MGGFRGGTGGPDPLENHKLYGFLKGIWNWTHNLELVGPPPPPPPLENVGPPLEPWKNVIFIL